MGYSAVWITLRPLPGHRPDVRELEPIHHGVDGVFSGLCMNRLEGASKSYFLDAFDQIELNQERQEQQGQAVCHLEWKIYSHSYYEPFEHWLALFAVEAESSSSVSHIVSEKRLEVVASGQSLQALLTVRPPYYQYVTLTRGFYLLNTDDEGVMGLSAAPGIAPTDFQPKRDDFVPLSFFTSGERELIEQARKSPLCGCPICADMRKHYKYDG